MHDAAFATIRHSTIGRARFGDRRTALARSLLGWRDRLSRTGWPLFDLALRLLLAQPFLASGLLKLGDWERALYLAANEYPVSWASPEAAAILGVSAEIGGGALLALGLFTRGAGLALAALALVIQYVYLALDLHLYWALLAGWYVLAGAGPISLDALLRRGLADAPLPLAGALARAFDRLSAHGAPAWLVLLRCQVAWTAVAAAEDGPTAAVAAGLAALVVVGLAARPAALGLIGMSLAAGLVMALEGPGRDAALLPMLALGLIIVRGPGRFSLDALVEARLRRRLPNLFDDTAWRDESLPHVVIVGAGFGGVAAAQALRDSPCRVTIIDRHNYHLFQPLLYQVATAGLSAADIAAPIRELFRGQPNARVVMGRVDCVDRDVRRVRLEDGRAIAFDWLVVATGARHSYFGKEEWERFAPGLKKIEDATDIRRRILTAFEQAEMAEDPAERQAWLTFCVVGGGPTGVELAGAIAELARHGLGGEFRNADPAMARVILAQSGDRLLPAFPETLSARTERALRAIGVDVVTNARVTHIDADAICIGEERVPAKTVVWAAGVIASAAGRWLDAERDRAGRVVVGPDLAVPGAPEIFVVGDTAASDGWDGRAVPGLAPAAQQGGRYAAKVIAAELAGRPRPAPFRYRHKGSLATIGRSAAVADLGRVRLAGPLAWWLWSAIHVLFLTNARSRLAVLTEWAWAYLTFRRSTRLIAGD